MKQEKIKINSIFIGIFYKILNTMANLGTNFKKPIEMLLNAILYIFIHLYYVTIIDSFNKLKK